jgi:hypothetical protein
MNNIQVKDFKKAAFDAQKKMSEENQLRTIENKRLMTENTAKQFKKLANMEPGSVDGKVVITDGIELHLCTIFGSQTWRLIGRCPTCGKEVESKDCHELWQIGELLINFVPNESHSCCSVRASESREADYVVKQFIAAWRALQKIEID